MFEKESDSYGTSISIGTDFNKMLDRKVDIKDFNHEIKNKTNKNVSEMLLR